MKNIIIQFERTVTLCKTVTVDEATAQKLLELDYADLYEGDEDFSFVEDYVSYKTDIISAEDRLDSLRITEEK